MLSTLKLKSISSLPKLEREVEPKCTIAFDVLLFFFFPSKLLWNTKEKNSEGKCFFCKGQGRGKS